MPEVTKLAALSAKASRASPAATSSPATGADKQRQRGEVQGVAGPADHGCQPAAPVGPAAQGKAVVSKGCS